MESSAQSKWDRRYLTQQYLYFLLRHRLGVCIFIALGTLFLGYQAMQLRVHTDFFNLYPPGHPYIQLYQQYRQMAVCSLEIDQKKVDRVWPDVIAVNRNDLPYQMSH